MPGADVGLRAEDPTIAELLKPLGYATGQFGKNHLGDKDEFLPTMHGFDEFFGNLYHLNAEEEPEDPDYPKDPAFKKRFGPRGVLHCWADGKGGQRIEDTGPLTKKRMETIDDEVTEHALEFHRPMPQGREAVSSFGTTRPRCTSGPTAPRSTRARAARETTTTSWSPMTRTSAGCWPSSTSWASPTTPSSCTRPTTARTTTAGRMAAITPFRSEKNTNWEGGWRVPIFVRWPGKIKPGTVLNDIASHQDWLPTLLAAAGEPDIAQKLLKGHQAGDKTFKVHIDGYNLLPYLTGEAKESPRKFFFYISDDGDILAIRMGDWKVVLMEQRAKQLMCWFEPFVKLRAPKMFNLRRDPFERADENSNTYWDWVISHAYLLYEMQALVAQQIEDFVKFPPRQKPAAFNLDEVLRHLQEASGSANH